MAPRRISSIFADADARQHQFELRRKNSFSLLFNHVAQRSMAGMYSGKVSKNDSREKSKIFNLMPSYTSSDTTTIQKRIVNHVEYTLACTRFTFSEEDCYRATAYSIRDRLIETLNDTKCYYYEKDVKRCYYLSLEFLIGRAMQNALVNLDIERNYEKALEDLGYSLEVLYEYEHDAALGNGGLGRLAACFLDSMSTLNYACWGYGIRYTYGIFEQKIIDGRQVEHPDYWLVQDNPWEIPRHDITYGVRFFGTVHMYTNFEGRTAYRWVGGQVIQAVAYDNPIPGFDTLNCNCLRLWRSVPSREFDFESFNEGKYLDSVAERQEAECISAVLYPNDESEQGKLLRLKQQYFFCCATIQDCLRRFKKKQWRAWSELPSKVSIQLNDTHPTIAIPELMRILVDIEGLEWSEAWGLTKQIFNYTNHTVLPEALEKWDADLLGRLLPRHLLIINDINMEFLLSARALFKEDSKHIEMMSVYAEGYPKMLRMANLAVIGSNKVNGVAALHTELLKRDLFPHFVEYYKLMGEPTKFINITNGITPRRWIHCANRPLSNLISEWLGSDSWLKDLSLLQGLEAYAQDPEFIEQWIHVKKRNKQRLADYIERHLAIVIDADKMLFDVQVKRIHEYKRQLLNCFHMIHKYLTLKRMTIEERKKVVPRVTILGGKAAPSYTTAKSIIRMVNSIANIVNNDPDVHSIFKVVFIPNYNVSQAMIIIPAADINQQISTAGMEASGTGNMKFVLNASLIVGTLDGATVEICEETGIDTMFIFGAKEHEIHKIREQARKGQYPIDPRLQDVFDWIKGGHLALGNTSAQHEFLKLVQNVERNGHGENGDYFLLCHDFPSFARANEEADQLYKTPTLWAQKTIKGVMSMGKFSTDRTIREYSKLVWGLEEAERPPSSPPAVTTSTTDATDDAFSAPISTDGLSRSDSVSSKDAKAAGITTTKKTDHGRSKKKQDMKKTATIQS